MLYNQTQAFLENKKVRSVWSLIKKITHYSDTLTQKKNDYFATFSYLSQTSINTYIEIKSRSVCDLEDFCYDLPVQ